MVVTYLFNLFDGHFLLGNEGREFIEQALEAHAAALDEDAGKQFFAAYGIAVPQGGTVTSADAAVELAERIGYPVVMKGSAPAIQHKTDAGLVLLRIGDDTEVREAYRTLEARAAAAGRPHRPSAGARPCSRRSGTFFLKSLFTRRDCRAAPSIRPNDPSLWIE